MKAFLADHGVAFEERDVSRPAVMEELLSRTGGVRGTPVVVIGDEVIRGFDRGRITRLLGL
ncbi:MAG: glutaredoxin family protein [Bacillota bacterium]|nr:glutaredoxin family protein [Bacillota bacterium]